MRQNSKKVIDQILSVPLPKWFGERLLTGFYICLAVAMMALSQSPDNFLQKSKTKFWDLFSPVMTVITTPVQAASDSLDRVTGWRALEAENVMLREENARLKEWFDRAQALMDENKELKKITALDELPRANYMTGRVIADPGGNFSKSILIDKGTKDGVKVGFAAVTPDGLAGVVVSVGGETARILRLEDINSRIPVMTEKSGHTAILIGDNDRSLTLKYLNDDAIVEQGERIVTSGRGGLLAPNVPVAVITKVQADHAIAHPLAIVDDTKYIQLIDFGRHKVTGTLISQAEQ